MKRSAFVGAVSLLALWASLAPASAVAKDVRLVLKGYDPVAYFTDGKPAKGDPRFSYDLDDERYHFTNARHRNMFAGDPERYAPQFSGYCTGSMARGVRNEGNPEAWVIVDGQLYVFGATDSTAAAKAKQAAEQDPAAFRVKARAAHKNWKQ